jgi:hypothetical protein
MKASDAELKQEIDQIKKRVSSLEKAFDSVLTSDDSKAIEEARQDRSRQDRDPFRSQEKALLRYEVRLSKSQQRACIARAVD